MEMQEEIELEVAGITAEVDQLELQTLFSNKHDKADVLFAIHAGAGGTEAQDWAAMLLRMFLRWAEAAGFSAAFSSCPDQISAVSFAVTAMRLMVSRREVPVRFWFLMTVYSSVRSRSALYANTNGACF